MVVLEKGHYVRAKDLPLLEKNAMSTMYERGGTLSTHDLGESSFATPRQDRLSWTADQLLASVLAT